MTKGSKVRFNGGEVKKSEMAIAGVLARPDNLMEGQVYIVTDVMELVAGKTPVCHLQGMQGIFKQEWFTEVA